MIKKEKIAITLDKEIIDKLNELSLNQSINKSKFINKIIKEHFLKNDINRKD